MGFLHNYLSQEPAYKDGCDLPLLGADGFRSGHKDTMSCGVSNYAQRRGATDIIFETSGYDVERALRAYAEVAGLR
jgi:hypothetical protein